MARNGVAHMSIVSEKNSDSRGMTSNCERFGSSKVSTCGNCGHSSKCRRRTFSEQAWTVLLLWNEINPGAVDQAICEDCYQEMRDILIDRTDEIDLAMQQSDKVAKIKEMLGSVAS